MKALYERIIVQLNRIKAVLEKRPMITVCACFIIIVLTYLISMLAWINLAVLVCIATVIQGALQLALHDALGDKRAGVATWLLVLSVGVSLAALLAWPMMTLSRATGVFGICKTMALGLGFLSIVGAFVFAKGETGTKAVDWFKTKQLSLKKEERTSQSGDIVLCLDKAATEEKHRPVQEIMPYKDRFLHTLVLGPTGTGKTSQILLPMINQDLQNSRFGITVIEPKGDLAEQVAMMADYYGRPRVYFDPYVEGCPFYNPLVGPEDEVIASMTTTFRMLNASSSTYFLDQDESLAEKAIKVLKRLDAAEGVQGKYATFVNMSRLLQNSGSAGRDIINKFRSIAAPTEEEGKENFDIASWFLNDYFAERSKVYQDTSELRTQLSKINSNAKLRRVLNPDIAKGEQNEIDFEKHLEGGGILCVSTAQGALGGKLGSFLGYFLILQFQAAVFRRPGDENSRTPHALYIDEFQTYATPGFSDMLTQGRSYRVACVLATQARAQMAMGGGADGRHFVDLVDANARNLVIFPGVNYDDAKYYSNQFGEIKKLERMKSISRKRFNLITGGMDRLGHPSESIREQMKSSALFSPTDITNHPFGEITYRLIQDNNIQRAKVGVVQFIPKELNEEIKRRLAQFKEDHQSTDESPKAATDIVWDDGQDGVEDLGDDDLEIVDRPESGEDTQPQKFVPFQRPATPGLPSSKDDEDDEDDGPKEQVLDWDLLDTSGNPEDGFEEVAEDDDLLGM